MFLKLKFEIYCNDPKFSDKQVWANSVDLDQTDEQSDQGLHCLPCRSSLIWVYTVCYSVCIVWTNYSVVKGYCCNFRIVTSIFQMSEYLGIL